ncbi:hypothetical protein B0H14DRAFT_178430 [Mycena olivaceomarginata]|nr:hypothetical protein B0H14DRAFT_178430 [Mycena olivaceomarginata]
MLAAGAYPFRLALILLSSPGTATMNHSLFSSTPSPARLQPFSLAEFLDVFSAALNSDSPAPPLALSLRTLSPALQRNKSLPNLHTPALRLARAAPADGTQEARHRHPTTATLRASSAMPCNLDHSSAGGDSLFTPYLPLAVLYDRGLAAPSSYTFTCASPLSSSSLLSPPASESPCASASASDSSHAPPSPPRSAPVTADAPFP